MQSLLCAGVISLLGGLTLVSGLPMDNRGVEEPTTAIVDVPGSNGTQMTKNVNRNPGVNRYPTLRYISVVTRHGHRSPTNTFPTDPYPYTDLRYWPDGPGQLTMLGKQQLFRTGRLLRKRYDGFLNANYFPNQTSVRTNPYDRDFMSAACLLAGLYPPVGYQLWNRKILWNPIPIWEDSFDVAQIVSRPAICPRFIEEMHRAFHVLDRDFPKYRDLLEYLSRNMGQTMSKISRVPVIWDILEAQTESGYTLPAWATKVFPDQLAELEGRAFRAYVGDTPEQIRLSAGPVLGTILDQLNEKSRGVMSPDRKAHILAAHDVTLRALLSGLGINDAFPVATSAFMVFELHEKTQDHIIQVLYFNSSSKATPRILDMPSCRNPCSLTTFNKVLEPVIPSNWREECFNLTKPEI